MSEQSTEGARRPIILLVEDEPAVRRSLQLVLQGNGFAVRSYASGAALLQDPSARTASGLIADYRLQGSDGLLILRALRLAGFDGRAILITAYGSSELTMQALAAGFSDVLEKPLAPRALSAAVADLIG